VTLPAALLIRPAATCPVCQRRCCLTVEGRLWIHGPRAGRCPGSRLHLEAARHIAQLARGFEWIHPSDTYL
jgi:hypothetical protein